MIRYFTSADAARVLGVTPAAVRAMAKAGRLPVALRTESGIQLFSTTDVERVRQERQAIVDVALKQTRTA